MSYRLPLLVAALLLNTLGSPAFCQSREEVVRSDRKKVEAEGFWMYNDIPGAFAEAKKTGKPIVVVLRCLPCHECVKLDDELVDTHPVIRPLLEQFVCVRQVATNGLDLTLFQYDTDQSFVVFFLNADRTIYGRFGTRSHRTDWLGDVSLKGLTKALQAVLDLHRNFATVRGSLQGKTGSPLEVASPEKYPSLRDKFTDQLDYEGDVVKSCIHCHQIGDAQREFYWHARKPIPEQVLFPYPHPRMLGLIMDPDELATVKDVRANTPADAAGLQQGDVISSFDGQPMLSIADLQWVLHHTETSGGSIPLTVERGDKTLRLKLDLQAGWRRQGDISWRVTSWGLRRIAGGGMVLETANDASRKELSVPDGKMALRVKRVGRYGPHGTAKRVGIREGDVIVSFDGQDDLLSEQELHRYVVTSLKFGHKAPIEIRRKGQPQTFRLPIQK